MSERMAKKIRKEIRRRASQVYADARDYKRVINKLSFIERLKASIRLLRRRF